MTDPQAAVIVLFHTIMDGPVLRWYHSEAAAKSGSDYMSASRNGLYISEFYDRIPETELAKAQRAVEELKKSRPDVSGYPTHERPHFGSRELKPIQREESTP